MLRGRLTTSQDDSCKMESQERKRAWRERGRIQLRMHPEKLGRIIWHGPDCSKRYGCVEWWPRSWEPKGWENMQTASGLGSRSAWVRVKSGWRLPQVLDRVRFPSLVGVTRPVTVPSEVNGACLTRAESATRKIQLLHVEVIHQGQRFHGEKAWLVL